MSQIATPVFCIHITAKCWSRSGAIPTATRKHSRYISILICAKMVSKRSYCGAYNATQEPVLPNQQEQKRIKQSYTVRIVAYYLLRVGPVRWLSHCSYPYYSRMAFLFVNCVHLKTSLNVFPWCLNESCQTTEEQMREDPPPTGLIRRFIFLL